jgi:hypothetical protein
MNESFIHYVWQYQYFDKVLLTTATGEPIHVFSPGSRNSDAGPDFLNARIRVGEIQWVGSVEIHICASGWKQHAHDTDEAYDNVILHVVWTNDIAIHRRDATLMPTLELKHRVDGGLLSRYKELVGSMDLVPCASWLSSLNPLIVLNTLDRMLLHRLQHKSNEVFVYVNRNRGDWEETCYQLLAKNFGFKVNAEPFLQLALALPLKTLLKHSDKLLQLEAMLFGVAGFLDAVEDDDAYYSLLKREYNLLRIKYRLDHREMNKVQWKFLRLRPANFPTLRIAQFAAFLHNNKKLLSGFLEHSATVLKGSFKVHTSEYWQEHYHFSARTSQVSALGDSSVENLLINTVVPVLAAYARYKDDMSYMERAEELLHCLLPESNKITSQWERMSVQCKDAFDSQALIELNNNFCSRHRCLDCNIGASLVKPVPDDRKDC